MGRKTVKLVGINGRYSHSTLALFYIRNEVEQRCPEYTCAINQFTINDSYYELLLRLTDGTPSYLFFSAAIWNSTLIARLCHDLQRCLPGCRLVIGGPQAAALAHDMDDKQVTIVLGPIEQVEDDFFSHLSRGDLRRRYESAPRKLGKSAFGSPYRSEDFATHLANRYIYYESSRGCPFRCTYCLSAAQTTVYHKPLATVEQELTEILSHHPKMVRFVDRTFNDIPERALAIWRFLQEHGGGTLFHFEIAPDRFTAEMFDFLAEIETGRFQFEIGIQSTNHTTLTAIERRIDPHQAGRTIRRLAAASNIHLHADLILGLPYETKDSFMRSFRDLFAMAPHYMQMGLLKILPDTPIAGKVKEFAYVFCKEPPYAVLANGWMNHETLSELYWFSECVEKFVNNRYFISFWQYLRETEEDVFRFFMELLGHCRRSDFFARAATQELMTSLLMEMATSRNDHALVVELLRYDWLRCGFRYLPKCLEVDIDSEQPDSIRSHLYQQMAMEVEGVYTRAERNYFFRKSYFLQTSREFLAIVGIEARSPRPVLCFRNKKEENCLYGLTQVLVLDGY